MSDIDADEHEALIQFLYMAPIGLVQARLDGEILMVNPLCAQLLMPLSPDGTLENLFRTLADVAPDLALRARQFGPIHGLVCDALQLPVRAGPAHGHAHRVLSLSLLKLDSERLMAVLSDVTQAVQRERELQQKPGLDRHHRQKHLRLCAAVSGPGWRGDRLEPEHCPRDRLRRSRHRRAGP